MDLNVNEKQYRYPIQIDARMYACNGAFNPAAYQNMVVCTIEEHLKNLGSDLAAMIERHNVSWFLLSMSMEICRPFHADDTLSMRTWCSDIRVPIYRREFEVLDASDTVIAVGTSFWSILDLAKRRIVTEPATHALFALPCGEMLLFANSRFTEEADYTHVERRFVRPSSIDGLGHVNNSRYGDFVLDALDASERGRLLSLRRLDVWFHRELQLGAVFDMCKASSSERILVRGMLEDGQPSFTMKLTF